MLCIFLPILINLPQFCVTNLAHPVTNPLLYSHHHPPLRIQHAQYRHLPQDEKDKINADLAASGIAYKERLGLPYDLYETENQQPEHLRPYFRERLEHYREIGKRFSRGFEYENN
ncbi:DNA polymerase III subunit theta [Morganella morganii]|uniref:DNA polymerase III subunit theta n=1 Tax=Morganella morganii TaxID=582 RepID=UPI0013D646BE|nr:DNA polymerase III subunit theta [Morganella morganii]